VAPVASSGGRVKAVFVLLRSLTYGSLFVALLLVLLPARVLEWSGITRPAGMGVAQWAGGTIAMGGAALAVWCVLTFWLVGRGTPAPFDPPRRLVVSGPYRWVRNPMYLGAVAALMGAALYYGSVALAGYGVLFFALAHVFVRAYEEPTLRRTFGAAFEAYRHHVGRWLPRAHDRTRGERTRHKEVKPACR
jgi:protein-S-isoprenylcysteine O-methyltransferase Ste14